MQTVNCFLDKKLSSIRKYSSKLQRNIETFQSTFDIKYSDI